MSKLIVKLEVKLSVVWGESGHVDRVIPVRGNKVYKSIYVYMYITRA